MMDIEIKGGAAGPVYAQIREQIEAQIRDQKLKSGEALPSLVTLAQKLSVDKGEIQRAYFELENAAVIVKQTSKDFLGKEKTTYTVK